MAIGAIAGIIGAVATISSVAYQMSQRPANLNLGNASAAGVQAQAEMLPIQRMYQQAAQTGGWAVRYGYDMVSATPQRRQQMQSQIDSLNQQIQAAQAAQSHQSLSGQAVYANGQNAQHLQQLTQQRNTLQQQLTALPANGGAMFVNHATGQVVPRNQAIVDFSGMGTAQVQSTLAREMAQVQLNLQQKYGTQFATEARNELEQSDPEGTAARAQLYNLIEQQNNETPDRPVATLLDKQVGEQLASGNRLDPAMRSVLDDEVQKAMAARGGDQNADSQTFADPMEQGMEGQQRRLAGIQKATGWLSSGSTPEDVAYRREQQNLANLGAFVNGQTPEAQFRNLSSSGGQQGATPWYPGQALPQAQNGASNDAMNYATAGYLRNLQYQQTQMNPWMAGLSSLLTAGRAAGQAGWQPFGTGSGTGSGAGGLG